jgi:hypothetical protein
MVTIERALPAALFPSTEVSDPQTRAQGEHLCL